MPFDTSTTCPRLALVSACNDDDILHRNLLASPLVRKMDEIHVLFDQPSAAKAYNRALDQTSADIVIFAHQDVYFPPGWQRQLDTALAWLKKHDPNWAVLAPFGMIGKRHHGSVYSTSLSGVVGARLPQPQKTSSIDELVIILRRDSGLRFDESLPDWHLYGTDIVLAADARDLGAWIAHMPVVHNDRFHRQLGRGFGRAYRAVWRKWRSALPVRTPVLWISWHGLDLAAYRLRAFRSRHKRKKRAGDTSTDPRVLSASCGWEAGQ